MTVRAVAAAESALRRDRALVLAGIAGVAALAWAYLVHVAGDMGGMASVGDMAGEMAMPPARAWGPADLALTGLMWTVMMIAMMVPTAAPLILLFASANRRHRESGRPFAPTGVFVLGYVVVWSGFAVLATGAQWGLHVTGVLSSRMGGALPVVGGAILVTAGVFQWTPLKQACLRHCRTPFGFLMTEWRDGTRGALHMGVRHGGLCLGCCWALMSLMFVGGVMSFLWMAGIAIYVLAEKVVPAGHIVARVTGLVLVAWGLATIASPLSG